MRIAIIGATGYGGAELIRILTNHPKVSLHTIHSSSQHEKAIQQSYPHFQSVSDHILMEIDTGKIASEVDLVFTATPSGISSRLVPELTNKGLKVIDLSGDYRLKNTADYTKWYKKEAGDDYWIHDAVYGLTEWLEDDLSETRLIANPGCYPTAVLLGLAPLVKNHMLEKHSIIIDAKTGITGAGRNPSPSTHFSEINDNLKIYKVNAHQHTPEIEQVLSSWDAEMPPITFSTHLVPMTRGIMATMYANLSKETTIDQLFELYQESYTDAHFVRIRNQGTFPSTKEVYGSNYCDVSLAFDERTNRITVVSVIDNLMKGAAGQAVQNMNKMLGIDEKTGLDFVPVYP